MDQKIVFVGTPNAFVAEMLEQRMYSLIHSALYDVLGHEVEAEFVVVGPEESPNGIVQTT